jgi:hypothetical protein
MANEGIIGPLALELDEVGSFTYIGEALPGSPTAASVWRIQRLEEVGEDSIIIWADGNSNFDNVWDNRLSLSYS